MGIDTVVFTIFLENFAENIFSLGYIEKSEYCDVFMMKATNENITNLSTSHSNRCSRHEEQAATTDTQKDNDTIDVNILLKPLELSDRAMRIRTCFCTVEQNQMQNTTFSIDGYEKTICKSLEEAFDSMQELLPDIIERVKLAKMECSIQRKRKSLIPLKLDEAAAIYLYTMEWETNKPSLYSMLNVALRNSASHSRIEPWFGYLRFLLRGLFKLPSEQLIVWRGVTLDLSHEYQEGQVIVWRSLSSCTESISLLQSDQFLGQNGKRTLFSIECCRGKQLAAYSAYPDENEIVLLPGTQLLVVSTVEPAADLHIIHLREILPEPPRLPIPMTDYEIRRVRQRHHLEVNRFFVVDLKDLKASLLG